MVSGQQAMVLAGEYQPANRDGGDAGAGNMTLPAGGAVLQRVTLLAAQPDSTVVLLRADYAPPSAANDSSTYTSLAPRSRASAPALLSRDAGSGDSSAAAERHPALSSAYLAPASLYARTQDSAAHAGVKGSRIDVLA